MIFFSRTERIPRISGELLKISAKSEGFIGNRQYWNDVFFHLGFLGEKEKNQDFYFRGRGLKTFRRFQISQRAEMVLERLF